MYLSDLMCQVLSLKSLLFSPDGVWIVKRVSIFISWSLSDFPLRTRFVSGSTRTASVFSPTDIGFRGNLRCKSSASDPNKNAEVEKYSNRAYLADTFMDDEKWHDCCQRRRAAKRIDGLWVIFDTSMGKQTTNNKLCSVKWIQIQRQS